MRILLLATSLLVLGSAYASSITNKVWLEGSIDGKHVECPNAIKFLKTTYEVFNDCYGYDPKSPLVETGNYTYSNDTIIFSNRNIKQAGVGLVEGNKAVTAIVKEIKKASLKLVIDNEVYLFVSR